MSKVIVIGGGAAGMMSAFSASDSGHEVVLIEKNEKLGKKIFITGKGRCNVTNISDIESVFENTVKNKKFLYSAIYGFSNEDTVRFFEENGLKLKTERGNRVFPESDKSYDVINTLSKALKKSGVKVLLNTKVSRVSTIIKDDEKIFEKVILENGDEIYADSLIIATGGLSYPSTGSDGDGLRFAKDIGHKIIRTVPGLVPLNIKEEYVKELQGLSLKNVNVKIFSGKKKLYDDFGEMLFTHFGVSGPLILTASSIINKNENFKNIKLVIDLKPALSKEELDKRILRDFEQVKNKNFKNSLDKLLPKKLIPVIINLSGIDPEKKVNDILKEERSMLIQTLKEMEMTVSGLRGFNEAIITSGGIDVKEINPATMESKLVKKLYFCGEIIDIDAFTGGYNLQLAWSTGYLAGKSIS